ncbi:hypothetical protein WNZ15_22440 [Roseibium sp. AS2]|uniref:hypothetical protein n=1 Tax=Roseibium sp. AS2 TaxID=3135781 RepID=UPI003172DED8
MNKQRQSITVVFLFVFAFILGGKGVLAQSVAFTEKNLKAFFKAFEDGYAEQTGRNPNTLETTIDAWQELVDHPKFCLGSVTVNGEAVHHGVAGPFVRYEAAKIAVVTRSVTATWGNEAVSFSLVQRFNANNGKRRGSLELTGLYFSSPKARPAAIIVRDKWADTSFKESAPPVHQPWGLPALTLSQALPQYTVTVRRLMRNPRQFKQSCN